MSKNFLPPNLYAYLTRHLAPEPAVFAACREATASHPESDMLIPPEQGQFMAFLLRLMGARRVIEIGTFTGYSALWLASALPEDGQLITLDIDAETTKIAQDLWQKAGMADRIELRLAPALDSLQQLLQQNEENQFDAIFIDANKRGYGEYFELGLRLLRPGGLMIFDNMLQEGRVADPAATDKITSFIRDLNQKLAEDARVEMIMLALADGLVLARKK